MTDDPTPTTLRRQLGARLRQLRQERGETAQDVATALRVSLSKVSRMESGARTVSERDLNVLLRRFEVDGVEAEELAEIARAARRRRGAWVDVTTADAGFQGFVQSGFVELERDAIYVREFNEGIIPGLLQTAEYIHALMSAAGGDSKVVRRAIDLRVSRQRRLERYDQYSVIVDEAALRREVGGPKVMAQQLGAILDRIEEGVVHFKVIPLSSGYYPGLNSSFVALTLDEGAPDAAFTEGIMGFQQFDGPDDFNRFERVWQQLTEIAWSTTASRRLLRAVQDSFRVRTS